MTSTSKTVVFFGSGPVAAESLKFLAAHFAIEAIVTKPVPTHHKGIAPVEAFASTLDVPVFFANNKKELDEIIKTEAFKSNVGIIIDYGVIVSRETIDSFPLGIVNSHFSLLPEWRGADPITFSILSGQEKTGVSLMLIETELDTGKLLTQKVLPIDPEETTPSLTDKLITLSNQLILEYLPRYQSGELTPKSQPHPDRASYSHKLTKQDGIIGWQKSAQTLEREIRAYKDWPQSRATIGGLDLIVTKAHIAPTSSNRPGSFVINDELTSLTIATTNGDLAIDSVKPAGKKEMPTQAFLNGYRSKLQ